MIVVPVFDKPILGGYSILHHTLCFLSKSVCNISISFKYYVDFY